jgi:hypothetical protein
MSRHYAFFFREKIAELNREIAVISAAAREAERHSLACLSRLKEEERRRKTLEDELERERREKSELRAKAALWERNGKDLHAELEKTGELSRAHSAALKRIKELEKKLNIRKGTENPYGLATPSSKRVDKPNSIAENRSKRGGAKVGHKGSGRKDFKAEDADIIRRNETPPAVPCCGSPRLEKSGERTHCVWHFKPMELQCVMNVNTVFGCLNCGQTVAAPTPDAMPGAKYSNAAVAQLLAECYFHQSAIGPAARRAGVNKGTLIGLAHRCADALEPLFQSLLLELRKSVYAHADETGWSMDGKKAYAWLFANDDLKIFLFRESRGSKVPKEALGGQKLGLILITDRYGGYTPLAVERQMCFVHIQRDLKKLLLEFPEDPQIAAFGKDLMPLLTAAIKLRPLGLADDEYLKRASLLQDSIMTVCRKSSRDPGIQHIQDIFRLNEAQLFHWVKNPAIPCENNYAERGLRPIVISRKISFGCQSERGMRTREILMTILHTAKCRGHDPEVFLERALNALALNPKTDLTALLPRYSSGSQKAA